MTLRRWLVAACVALVGALETAWLTVRWLGEGHMPCAGSGRLDCAALFLASGTTPLGLPLVVWGHFGYASTTLLAVAAVWLEGGWSARARAAFHAVAIGMALFSLFLVARMVALAAFCPWCVLSAALSLTLGAIAAGDVARGGATRDAAAGVGLAAAMVALTLTTGGHRAIPPAGDPGRLEAIAQHLTASGARFYGVWWCTACREQKELFGAAAADLPYVESSRTAPEGVDKFPTWEIAGHRVVGAISPDSLAKLSGFESSP
jgi:uncharacterized membrane protein